MRNHLHRVLVVEDEPEICALFIAILELEGFQAHCVLSDEAARALLRHHPAFGCVIIDVNLGAGATGYDVARFLRQIDPQLPVIYVSGQITEVSFEANGVPGSLFIPKPFTPDELLQKLRTLVGDNDD